MKSRTSYVDGTITLSDGTKVPFDDSIIVKDTLYVENQCVNNNALEFGAVYAAECGFTLLTDIDRYKLFNAKIKFSHFVDGKENVMGEFVAYDSNRVGSKVSVKALDRMTDFDISVTDIITGTPYELLQFFCDTVGIVLANTQSEIDGLVNAGYTYSINSVDVSTYRDAISYLCKVMCAYAYIDNLGRLKIAQFELNSSRALEKEDRLADCSISDFETIYSGAKCRFLAEENFYPYSNVDEARSGIVMDLGDIPIVNLTPEIKQTIIGNIAKYVSDIIYTPSELNVPAVSDLKLGTMIKCKDINNTSNSVNTLIMKYKWQYRRKEIMYSYGENPRLQNITQKTQNASGRTEAAISSQKMVVNSATNIEDISTQETVVELVELGYTAASDCRPIIYASVQFYLNVDGEVEFSLYNSSVLLKTYKQYYKAGNNYALLMYVDTVDANSRNKLVLKCKATMVESVERKQSALLDKIKVVTKYSSGDLIVNNACMWEQGDISSSGADTDSSAKIRTAGYIQIAPGTQYKIMSNDNKYSITGALYGADKAFISTVQDYTFTTPANAMYVRWIVKKSDGTDITQDESKSLPLIVSPTYEDVVMDATVPTITCETDNAHLYAYTQGIGVRIDWNGVLEFSDRFKKVNSIVNMANFNATLNINDETPQNCNIVDTINNVKIGIEVIGFTDNVETEVTDES